MKKTLQKAAVSAVSALLLTSMLASCGGNSGSGESASNGSKPSGGASDSASAKDSGEAVTVHWYFPDDLNNHTKVVWDALNTYFKEKINTVVNYHIVPWGEYADKTNTVMTSGQEFDMMFQNAAYFTSVGMGAAQPVEDLIKTAAKETWETLPQSLWTAATVNGHIYGIPTYKDNAACPGLVFNQDMVDELGITMPKSYGALAELNDLFYEIKEKRDAKYPEDKNIPLLKSNCYANYVIDNLCGNFAVTNIPGVNAIKGKEEGEVFNIYATEENLAYYKMMKRWVDDGIYAMDAPNYDPESTIRNSGKLFCDNTLGYVSFPEHGWSEDVKTSFIPSTWRYMGTEYAMFGSNIIGAKSKNPDKALGVLNLVNTDNYVANTIRFGIEGDYYTKTDDNRLDFTTGLNSDPANRAYYRWYGWQFGSIFAMSLPAQEDPDLWTNIKAANEGAYISDNMGFTFDRSKVLNEITACTAVSTEFDTNFGNGMVSDVDATYKQYMDKLTASGVDKIVAEVQKQLNDWRKANGKSVFAG